MARTKAAENAKDPATGRPLPQGVSWRGPLQYRVRKLVDGTRQVRTFESARAAKEWLADTEAAARTGGFIDRRGLGKTTLRDLLERFERERLQDGGPRRGAVEDRTAHLPCLLRDPVAKLLLSKLTPAEVRGFRDRMAAAYAPATVVKRLNLLSGILAHARAEWDVPLPENPASAENVKRPEGADRKRARRLVPASAAARREAAANGLEPPPGEEERLLAALGSSCCPDDVPFTRFALAQATRRGEALSLRWRDVDLDLRILTLHGRHERGTKNEEEREELGPERRPMVTEAAAILRARLPEEGKPDPASYVFSVGQGGAFSLRFLRACRDAGIQDLTFHDLRHEATSRLAKRYTNPMDLMRVTGHRDQKSLNRYYQPDLTELAIMGETAKNEITLVGNLGK